MKVKGKQVITMRTLISSDRSGHHRSSVGTGLAPIGPMTYSGQRPLSSIPRSQASSRHMLLSHSIIKRVDSTDEVSTRDILYLLSIADSFPLYLGYIVHTSPLGDGPPSCSLLRWSLYLMAYLWEGSSQGNR